MLLLLLTLIPAFVLHAQDEGEEGTASMEDVIITATKTEQPVLDVPQHVTVITAEEIEESGVRDVAQILNRQAGIAIQDFGPLGAVQNVYVRGSTADQVLVLIDGIRINNAQSASVDLSLIPVNSIERIEIVRGGTSALYGSDAIGGVINIITRKEADGKLKIRIENGGYIPQSYVTGTGEQHGAEAGDLVDAQKVGVQYSRAIRNAHFTTSGGVYTADNEYIYKDENGVTRKRENAEIIGGDLTAALRLPVGGGNLDIKGLFISNKKGVPGKVSSLSPDAEQKDLKAQATVGYFTDSFISDVLTLNFNTFFNYSDFQYQNPDSFEDSKHEIFETGADLSQEVVAFSFFSLVYGGNLSYNWLDSNEFGNRERIYTGIFLETPLYITGAFTLTPMVRCDYYSDFGGAWSFKLAVNQALSSRASLKGNISNSFRAPTFSDLYWPSTMWAEGNPDLKPERGYSVDFGITRMGQTISYDLFLFTRYVENVIGWQEGSDLKWRPTNFDEAFYPGIEAHLDAAVTKSMHLNLQYTFLYSFNLSGELTRADDERMPYIPVNELDFGLDYSRRRFGVGFNGHFETKRYYKDPMGETQSLPSYVVFDAYYRQNIGKSTTFLLSVDNLFNKQYEVAADYPTPGLFIRTGFEFEF